MRNAPKSIWPSRICAQLQRTRTLVALTRASGSRREGGRLEFAHLVRRTHVGPHEAAGLARRIGFVLHPFRNVAAGRLGRHLHDVAVHVEFPAMIEAAQPALLVAREDQRGAPMRTVFVEHADAALGCRGTRRDPRRAAAP